MAKFPMRRNREFPGANREFRAWNREFVARIREPRLGRLQSRSEAAIGRRRSPHPFAFIYNALGVPVAAGVLYPFLGILLSPIIPAAAMALSSVSVIANAARLRTVRL